MNPLRRICYVLLAVTATTTACRNEMRDMDGERDQPRYFAAPEEAVAKARQDFIEVLRADVGLNLGVDLATLERSTPGAAVRRVDVDFERLLTADPGDSLGVLVQADRNTVVPLMADGRVATIVEILGTEEGWRVVGFAGSDLAAELTAVLRAVPEAADLDVTLYEIPNLQTRVYGVRTAEAERLFTDYQDFSIEQSVSADVLIPALRTDAVDFQRRFGDTLREQQLLR